MVRLRAMRWPLSPRWTARILVSAAAILPYLPVLTLSKIYITDAWFTSDIFNGELPSRVLVGKVLASGQAPVWSSAMCAGYPLAALGVSEPVSLLLFTLLPAAPALCLLVLGLVLVAAHGAYGFARRLGPNVRARSWRAWPTPGLATWSLSSSTCRSSRRLSGCPGVCCCSIAHWHRAGGFRQTVRRVVRRSSIGIRRWRVDCSTLACLDWFLPSRLCPVFPSQPTTRPWSTVFGPRFSCSGSAGGFDVCRAHWFLHLPRGWSGFWL